MEKAGGPHITAPPRPDLRYTLGPAVLVLHDAQLASLNAGITTHSDDAITPNAIPHSPAAARSDAWTTIIELHFAAFGLGAARRGAAGAAPPRSGVRPPVTSSSNYDLC